MFDGGDIPGQTPIDDISGLRDKSIRTREQLDKAEAFNIRKAVVKYLASRPTRRIARFDYEWLLQLHNEMFGDVWQWAGTLRTRELNLGSRPHEIAVHVRELLKDLTAWHATSMHVDEQAARLHHRAVQIHPFPNGNGRWSRMLANVWLRLNSAPLTEWPESTIGSTSTIRALYLDAIKKADVGDYSVLLGLHHQYSSPTKD